MNDMYNGKRYINWIRCSSNHQIETSVPDQLKLLNDFGEKAGMSHVDDLILDGVTGSVPGAIDDIQKLITRKIEKDDFDVLLVQDMSRLTRCGSEYAGKIECDLWAVGVEIIYVSEQLPQGDHASIIKSVGFYVAKQHAKAISFAATRGQMSAIAEGRAPYCSTPPYGVDRLIVGGKGEALFILRNMHDGSQQKLSTDGKTILQIFAPPTVKGKSAHYRRQADERVVLIPGSAESVETVRRIYRWHLVKGWGQFRIADELNRQGIKPLKGGRWNTSQVANILRNSIYLGRAVINRYTRAIYHTRSPTAPARSTVDRKELANRKAPRQRIRSADQWITIEHPQLMDYLDAELRPLVEQKQQKFWLAKAEGQKPPFSRDRHVGSPYILKTILKQKETRLPLTGRSLGPKGKKRRYYAIRQAFGTPSESLSRRHIPALPLEQAVLEQIKQALLAAPDLRKILHHQLAQQIHDEKNEKDDLPHLHEEKRRLTEQLQFVIKNVGPLGKAAAAETVAEIERKLEQVIEKTTESVKRSKSINIDEYADAVIERLSRMADSIDTIAPKALRTLLESMIDRLEIDMDSRHVELDLRLPPWAMHLDDGKQSRQLCLDSRPTCWSVNEAQWTLAIKIAEIDCVGLRKPNRFDCCRRQKRAA